MGSRLHRYSKPGINTSSYGRFTVRDYSGIDLSQTDLSGCTFREVILDRTNLRQANLSGSEFRQVALSRTDMCRADLRAANLILTTLDEVDLEGALFGQSHLGYSPIGNCRGLHRTIHTSESHIDFLTLLHSTMLPQEFFQHFGVEPQDYARVQRLRVDLYHDCFISYSSKDTAFAQALRDALIDKGVPCWFAPNDYRINRPWFQSPPSGYELGRDLFNFIDAAEIVVLILSTHSLRSDWVNEEMIRSYQVRRVIPIKVEDIDLNRIDQLRSWYNPIIQGGVLDWRGWNAPEGLEQGMVQLLPLLRKGSG